MAVSTSRTSGQTITAADINAIATQANLADGKESAGTAATAVEAHRIDTTAVHGIADTSALVLTSDARLSDARTPTAHTHPASAISDSTATGRSVLTAADAAAARTAIGVPADATTVGGTTVLRLGANSAVTNTTQTATAALTTVSLPAGTYVFEVEGFYLGSTTAQGLRASVLTGTATSYAASLLTTYSQALPSAASASYTVTNGAALGLSVASLTTGLPFSLKGSAVTSAAGTLAFRHSSQTTGSITVLPGTFLIVRRVS